MPGKGVDLMSLEQEAMKNFASEKIEEKQILEDAMEGAEQAAEPSAGPGLFQFDFSFLLKKTGPGPVESYLDHPMNAKRSKGRARFLRGCTGIAGDLDLAIIDIVIGGAEMMMEGRQGTNDIDQRG
jgi:hypothetical protein